MTQIQIDCAELEKSQRSYAEEGQYVSTCYKCTKLFLGGKRRVCCKLCENVYISADFGHCADSAPMLIVTYGND